MRLNMSKKIGVGYSFKEKSLEKENEQLRARIKELQKTSQKVENKKKEANKKAE